MYATAGPGTSANSTQETDSCASARLWDSEVTSTGGYAGSADLSSPVCYYNQGGVGVYSKLGHAEAVSIR